MFHHVKELQFNARVSKPDVRFAKLLLEQLSGPNGELKAEGSNRTDKSVQTANKKLNAERKKVFDKATAPVNRIMSWSVYEDEQKLKIDRDVATSKPNGTKNRKQKNKIIAS